MAAMGNQPNTTEKEKNWESKWEIQMEKLNLKE